MRKSIVLLLLLPLAGCSNDEVKESKTPASESPATKPEAAAPVSAPAAPAKSSSAAPAATTPAAPAAPAPTPITIPAGTKLTVILADALSSEKNHAGDKFTANLAEPLVINGKTVIAKGAPVQGKVVAAEESGRVKGVASMSLALTGLTVDKKAVQISTQALAQEAETTKGKDAAIVGGGAGIGTAIGALAGGKKGAAIGAVVGGGAGAGTVLATKGKEVEYPVESRLSFTVDKGFAVTP